MQFESTHVTGKGRGKPMGFPTVNLKIPQKFKLKSGIYAARVTVDKNVFSGALHYGSTPTFGEDEKSLEVYLIDVTNENLIELGLENFDGKLIKVQIIKYLRQVKKFKRVEELVRQIEEDVKQIKNLV